MNKIWMLALSNIRKNRSASVSLILIIFVAAVLMNLGLLTLLNYKQSFDDKAKELNCPHAVLAMNKDGYQNKYEEYFTSSEEVTAVERTDIIFLTQAKYKYGTGEISFPAIIMNADLAQKMSPLSLVGEHKEIGDRDIYVSSLLKSGGGYQLGDDFTIYYDGKDYCFRIAGFTEDIMLGSTNVGISGFYLPKSSYERFYKEQKELHVDGVMLKVQLKDSKQAENLLADLKKLEFNNNQDMFTAQSWNDVLSKVKNVRTSTADIGGAIITSFSLIIVLVSLLVIRFRINTSVEDNITDIGALKAIGYTSRQIIAAFVLQFIQLAFCGAVLGITVSYSVVKPLAGMFSAQTGLVWEQGFDPVASLISLISLLLLVLIVSLLSASRIRKLHPITAMREGITTHSFKKNYFPLEQGKGSLSFLLAVKFMLHNVKQNIMILIIMAAVSFASVFGLVMFYNIAVNDEGFINMLGVEVCSLMVVTDTKVDAVKLCREIEALPDVRKAINYNYGNVMIGEEDCQVYITDDFAKLDNDMVYEGRNPLFDNEISISGFAAEKFGKRVGDTISLEMNRTGAQYIISGLIQTSNNLGMGMNITAEGIKRMKPDFSYNTINIYLKEGVDTKAFDKVIRKKFEGKIINTTNMEDLKSSQLGVYESIVKIFNSIILAVTLLLIVMILYLIIKALIIRRKKEFGIQKAIGYTTYQLMTQIAISYFPIILIGAVIGSVLGCIYMNPMLSILFRGIGVMKVDFVIPVLWVGLMCLGIGVAAYAVSMLISLRIRKITPYNLIVE